MSKNNTHNDIKVCNKIHKCNRLAIELLICVPYNESKMKHGYRMRTIHIIGGIIMIKNELRSLWNNKLLMVVLVAIMLIPALYAGLFLSSMWDPYGDLQYLPVAVVNKDKEVEFNDKQLHVGQDLADNLKENDSMAFNVVDEETAKNGLQNGTYYMVVTIPEDFSKNASSVMDDEPKKMILNYETNPGKNYISMKLSESAMKEIKANLTEEISKTYAETVFDSIQSIGDGFEDAINGTQKMIDGEDELSEGNDKISDNLGTLSESTLTFKEGTDTLAKGIKTYTDGVNSVDEGLGQLKKGTKSLSNQVVPGTKKLSDGAKTLNDGIDTYTAGVASASNGSDTLKAGSEKMLSGLQTMQSQLNGSLTSENVANIKALSSQALPGIKNGIDQLYNGLANADLSALSSLGNLAPALESANGYASNAAGAVNGAKDNVMSAAGSVGAAAGAVETAKNALNAIDSEDLSEEDKAAVLAALDNASASLGNAANSLGADGAAKQLAVAEGNIGGSHAHFVFDGYVDVRGNIMFLLNGSTPSDKVNSTAFSELFFNCKHLVGAKNLILPATTLAYNCYNRMFYGCNNLESAPLLQATTLAPSCYNSMFEGCSKLSSVTMLATIVPEDSCINGWLKDAGTSATERKLYVDPSMVDNSTIKDNRGTYTIYAY